MELAVLIFQALVSENNIFRGQGAFITLLKKASDNQLRGFDARRCDLKIHFHKIHVFMLGKREPEETIFPPARWDSQPLKSDVPKKSTIREIISVFDPSKEAICIPFPLCISSPTDSGLQTASHFGSSRMNSNSNDIR